ncbi:hypothetical protein [Paenibacillus sp. QZ-Y1]|uniref:hypothetical protein n=1 Tax=Paenibacillus sp. QZ-Y1 TaxID=3414511 RepID=UPI003F7A4A16
MKAVPKVNIDGLYLEDELVDDAFSGVVPFYAISEQNSWPEDMSDTDSDTIRAEKEDEIVGYIVGIPVPSGLFHPKFNLNLWESLQLDSNEIVIDLWNEGLTQEEIKELTKPPIQEPSGLDLLGNQLVMHELESLQLQQQNGILGNQIVQQEIENTVLKMQNEALGAQIVGVELRLLSMEGEQNV